MFPKAHDCIQTVNTLFPDSPPYLSSPGPSWYFGDEVASVPTPAASKVVQILQYLRCF